MNEELADQVYEIARKCAGDYNYPDADILGKAATALRALPPLRAREDREALRATISTFFAHHTRDVVLLQTIDALTDAILSSTAGQEWLPISSAPKDGRDLWLWKQGWGPKAVVGGWIKKSVLNDGRAVWMLYGGHVVEPTHWQPYYRPAPPVADSKEQK